MPVRKSLVLLLALLLTGGHTACLQVVAWASMLAVRVPQTSLITAVDSTFGGDAPCGLCRVVAELKAAEDGDCSPGIPPGTDKKTDKRMDSLRSGAMPKPGTLALLGPAVGPPPVRVPLAGSLPAPEPPPPRLTPA